MGLLQKAMVWLTGNDDIDDGSRRLAAEYTAMLASAGIRTRSREVEDEDGMAFISIEDAYGGTLAAVQGTRGRNGYLVAAAPFRGEESGYLFADPGEGAFLDDDTRDETLELLRAAGLLPPAEAE